MHYSERPLSVSSAAICRFTATVRPAPAPVPTPWLHTHTHTDIRSSSNSLQRKSSSIDIVSVWVKPGASLHFHAPCRFLNRGFMSICKCSTCRRRTILQSHISLLPGSLKCCPKMKVNLLSQVRRSLMKLINKMNNWSIEGNLYLLNSCNKWRLEY